MTFINLRVPASKTNSALRAVTGCHRAAAPSHLHHECKVMPVHDHQALLSTQFYASACRVSHPSHEIVSQYAEPRRKKLMLHDKCGAEVAPFLTDGVLPPGEFGSTMKKLHTNHTAATIERLAPNRVTGTSPPLIIKSERVLSRVQRTTLSQLRSGWCRQLKSYQALIGNSTDDLCPDCGLASHTTAHLFDCPSHPTPLTCC